MRILHLSDLHIGKQVSNISMINDQRYALEKIVTMIGELHINVLLIAGDIYDKSSPSEEAVRLFDWFLSEVAATPATVIAIPGNHDSAQRIAYAQTLLAKQDVHFAPAFDGSVTKVTLADDDGPVNFWLLPFLQPANVRRHFPEEEIGSDYTAALSAVLKAAAPDTSERNVILSHQFVTYASEATERTDGEVSLGGVDNVDVSVYESFDYVALGHVHRAQRIGRNTARYSGSLLKYHINEAKYDKSMVLVDLGPKSAGDEIGSCVKYELFPVPVLHDLRQIRGELDEVTSAEFLAKQNTDDYVHVVLTDEAPRIDALSKIQAAYPNFMALDYDNATTKQGAATVYANMDPVEIDPAALFAEFFVKQTGHELNDYQEELANKFMTQILGEGKGACDEAH